MGKPKTRHGLRRTVVKLRHMTRHHASIGMPSSPVLSHMTMTSRCQWGRASLSPTAHSGVEPSHYSCHLHSNQHANAHKLIGIGEKSLVSEQTRMQSVCSSVHVCMRDACMQSSCAQRHWRVPMQGDHAGGQHGIHKRAPCMHAACGFHAPDDTR